MKQNKTSLPEAAQDAYELLEDLVTKEGSVANPALPDPALMSYYANLQKRILDLYTEVEFDSVAMISKMILEFNRADVGIPVEQRTPIKLLIFSPGGDVEAMFHLIDICVLSKTPVYTINMGVAASAAFDILLAGSKRFCLPHSQVLVHLGSASFTGEAQTVQAHTKQYGKVLKSCEEWELERTKIPPKTYATKKKTEWFMNAKEQVENGIVDAIINDIEELL